MKNLDHTWAMVLAAGDGNRLRSLTTTTAGVAIPKQFCSLRGGPSLLQEALERAGAVATTARTCVVVARQHRAWWEAPLDRLPSSSIIVQPANCGTGNGILLSLLHIVDRDPEAVVLLLPSDHHVDDGRTLATALRESIARLRRHRSSIVLLGLEPEELDPDLGYIVPGSHESGLRRVERFVEKPSFEMTRKLLEQGALWNAFIVAARAQALIELFTMRHPQIVADMRSVVAHDLDHPMEPIATERLYRSLPTVDFSRDVLQAFPERLRVLTVPSCGWSDLGTPARVARTLRRAPARQPKSSVFFPFHNVLNLAEQHGSMQAG